MKIAFGSDLHFDFTRSNYSKEFRKYQGKEGVYPFTEKYLSHWVEDDYDILLLAGDIDRWDWALYWAHAFQVLKSKPVGIIFGNHEFYSCNYDNVLVKARELADKLGVHYFHDEVSNIDGVDIFGSTLWTDFRIMGPVYEYTMRKSAENGMSDYKYVRIGNYRKLTVTDTILMHVNAKIQLEKALANGVDVVLTHHAPSAQSLEDQYRNDFLSGSFASNLEDIILEYQPKIWIHGHLHNPTEYSIDKTTVFSNTRGYEDFEATADINTFRMKTIEYY